MSCFQFAATNAYSQSDDYNIKIGNLLLDFSVYGEYTYNDNVTTVPEGVPDRFDPTIIGPREDYIFSLGADVGINWQITDNNTLSVVLGTKYEDYQDLNYLDSQNTFFSINPDSQVEFKVLIDPFEFRVYDKFGYTVSGSNAALVEPVDENTPVEDNDRPIVRGRAISIQVDRYAEWTNEVGIEGLAILNPLEWTVGVRYFQSMPDDDNNDGASSVDGTDTLQPDRWEFTRRDELIIDSQLYYPLGRDNGAGIFGKYSDNNYTEEILADSTGWQFGGVVDWTLGERTALSVNAGYDHREFDEANTLKNPEGTMYVDILEGDSGFYGFELLNLIGQNFNHKLVFSRSVSLGRVTNQQISNSYGWDFTFDGIRSVNLNGGVQWVNADDSGPSIFAEHYDLFMVNFGIDLDVVEDLQCRFSYRYVDKDSDNNDRDYKQNLATLSLHYDF